MSLFGRAIIAISFWTLLLLAVVGNAQNLEQDASGKPMHAGVEINSKQYIPVVTKKLAKARVLWVNHHFLKEQGYQLTTGDMEQGILQSFAWSIPNTDDPATAFKEEEKTFYATVYGGGGLGSNLGDGRAAAAGKYQSKGIGRTPLVREVGDDHSNGKVSIEEGMREAYWGEINHQELPFDGNRVIAIIDRGTFTTYANGAKLRDVLIIREDPVRPAHFLDIDWDSLGNGQSPLSAESRLNNLLQALPGVTGTTTTEKLMSGLSEFILRLAAQYGVAFAKGLYHGATSESNIEISGRFLDYGTETSQPGLGKVKVIKNNEEAGGTREIKATFINSFVSAVVEVAPQAVKVEFKKILNPWLAQLNKDFTRRYQLHVKTEILKRIGLPIQNIQQVSDSTELGQLADALLKIATEGSKVYIGKYSVPDQVTTYDFNKLAPALSASMNLIPSQISTQIQSVVTNLPVDQVKILVDLYLRVQKSRTEKMSAQQLQTYLGEMHQNAIKINQPRDLGYRWKAMDRNLKTIEKFESSNDPNIIQRQIDFEIQSSIRGSIRPPSSAAMRCEQVFN